MTIDDRELDGIIVESQDLHVDSLREVEATLPELTEIGSQRRCRRVDLDEVRRYETNRRRLLSALGSGAAGMAGRSALAGGMGSLLAGLLASPARADTPLDIQILQTASSLEVLAVATYRAALALPFVREGNPFVVKFAETTMGQHEDHRKAFQAQTRALNGRVQTQPNPRFKAVVDEKGASLQRPLDVVVLAESLETVATQTYLHNTTLLEDTASKRVMASVMGVESQHAAVLRVVRTLLEGGAADLVRIPTEPGKLPAAAGGVAFPQAFEPSAADMIADPPSGAVR